MSTMTYEPQLTEGQVGERRTELLLDGRLVAYRIARRRAMTATGGSIQAEAIVREVCTRCGGLGHYSYNPLDGTRCYGCNGSGLGEVTTEVDILRRARNRAKAAERRARKAAEKAMQAAAEIEVWKTEHEAFWGWLRDFAPGGYFEEADAFLNELAARVAVANRPLTEKQMNAARQAYDRLSAKRDREREQKAAGHFGEVGKRVEVDVEVVFTKLIHTDRFDRSDSVLVVMRTAEGQTLKTFSSGAFGWEAEKGQQLRIRGTVAEHGEYDGLPETMLKRVTAVG